MKPKLFFCVKTIIIENNAEYHYITNTGSKYHSSGCSYLSKSKNAIDKASAIAQGYSACSRCNP